MVINTPFILASNSRSRYKILKQIGLSFKKTKPKCNEEQIKKRLKKTRTKPIKIVKALAMEKAKSVSEKNTRNLIVGCDTIIVFDNEVVDKAKTTKEAFKKIKKMSGKEHKIISAASVYINKKNIWSCHQVSKVKIRTLNNHEINKYLKIAGSQILNSVGCYQIESTGPMIIENVRGDFFNIMGFPLFPFLKFIKANK